MHRTEKAHVSVGCLAIVMVAVAALSGSCVFDTETHLCKATGLRCVPGEVCTAEQDGCTRDGCGDETIGFGEECDDGNLRDGDGCDSNCTRNRCGNGILTDGEECDDGNASPGDGCSGSCRLEF